MTYCIRLPRLALAITESTAEFVSRLSAETVAGVPEVSGPRLISDVAQHLAALAILDLSKHLAAKLEVVTLLIDRVTAVAVDQNAFFNTRDQIVKRRVIGPRLKRYVWHTREGDAAPTIAVIASV